MPYQNEEATSLLSFILDEAKKRGVSEAVAQVSGSQGLSIGVRHQSVETLEHAQDQSLTISVSLGKRVGTASSNVFSKQAVLSTLEAACDIAQYMEADPCSGLPDVDTLATDFPDLELYHPWHLELSESIELVRRMEQAGLEVSGIDQCTGAELSIGSGYFVMANTLGFMAGYPMSSCSLGASFLAKKGEELQTDYWGNSQRIPERLQSPEEVGRIAAERASRRLGARRLPTGQYPVLFTQGTAISLLSQFLSALGGNAQYQKHSFLLDTLGKQVAASHVSIYEDPFIKAGFGSSAFDDEGVATQARHIIKDGVVEGYFLSTYAARKLGMKTTGNKGGTHNLSLTSSGSQHDFQGLLKEMGTGLLVSSLMGQGFNMVTGDYSRGASGFWVENGQIQYPVQEITIAGNMRDMFADIVAVGTDVFQSGSRQSGSILIEKMAIAGT